MRIVKIIAAVIVVAIVAFLAWNWFSGPLKAKRQVRAFAAAMESCTPITQEVTFMLKGRSLTRAIKGKTDETCRIELQTVAPFPQFLVCDLKLDRMPLYAESFRRQNDNISLFGGVRLTIQIPSDDPMLVAMNGPECRLEEFRS